jgi:hypothetical protein
VIDAQPNQSGSIMALLDREDIGRGRTQVDAVGTGETNSASQYAAVNNIEALTLPVFIVVDGGLISEEMCQEGSSANAQRVFGTDNKLSAYRFAQFNVPQAGSYIVRLVTTNKPLGADGDPDFGVYDAQGLIGPDFADLTFQADLESHTLQLADGQHWAWMQDFNFNSQGAGKSGRYCQRLEVVPQ